MSTDKKEWLTTEEAARLAKVTPTRIRQVCASGLIDCRKFGQRIWQVDAQSLQEWIKKRGQ